MRYRVRLSHPCAVPAAGDMPNEDLIRAEEMAVRAPRRTAGYPFAIRGSNQVAEHDSKPIPINSSGRVDEGHERWPPPPVAVSVGERNPAFDVDGPPIGISQSRIALVLCALLD